MFYVIEEFECPECNGQGVVTHPAWELYHKEHSYMGILDADGHPDATLDVAWFQEQGYDYPPDEEVPCSECDGEGTIRREVELATALDALTREIIAELVETLGELLIHPDQAEARARALYRRHKHVLEEETDE